MESLLYLQRISLSLSRAAAVAALRRIDETNPSTWEFSAFSQNGEDGIIDYLCSKINQPNYYFVEVGASSGLENNTSWLAFGRKYEGLMFEGDLELVDKFRTYLYPLLLGVTAQQLFVNLNNAEEIISHSLYHNPDVFSLDIDGNDYYIVKRLLEKNFRPKIVIVEYNSAYGPEQSLSIKYNENFSIEFESYERYLYFGVSVTAWRKLLSEYGYKFITVDRRGVNAIFVDPQYFENHFLDSIYGLQYAENFYQLQKYRTTWEKQFAFIKDMDFINI